MECKILRLNQYLQITLGFKFIRETTTLQIIAVKALNAKRANKLTFASCNLDKSD